MTAATELWRQKSTKSSTNKILLSVIYKSRPNVGSAVCTLQRFRNYLFYAGEAGTVWATSVRVPVCLCVCARRKLGPNNCWWEIDETWQQYVCGMVKSGSDRFRGHATLSNWSLITTAILLFLGKGHMYFDSTPPLWENRLVRQTQQTVRWQVHLSQTGVWGIESYIDGGAQCLCSLVLLALSSDLKMSKG